MNRRFRVLVLVGLGLASICFASGAQISAQKESLPALDAYFRKEDAIKPSLPKYTWYKADLRDDQKEELIVHVHTQDSCGNAGCTVFIFEEVGNTLKLVAKFTVSRDPIYILDSKTNGWHDVAISTRGRDAPALMKFNGTTYPKNPSVQKAMTGPPEGRQLEPVNWSR